MTYILVMLAVVLIGHVCRKSSREYDGLLCLSLEEKASCR